MSKVDVMVQRLCPDGVEYKKLGEVANVQRGVRVVKKNLSTDEGCPVYQNSLTPLGYFTESNEPAGTPFVIGAGAAAEIGFSDVAYWGADDCYSIECSDGLDGRFVYHALLDQQPKLKMHVRKASIPRLARTAIERLEIPAPPLDVQREVVRVLDSFVELEARRTQYAHYRDELLSRESLETMAGGEVSIAGLGDLMTVQRGASPRPIKQYVTNEPDGIPWIKIGDVAPGAKYISQTEERITKAGANKSRYLEPGSFVLSNSMSFGRPYILQLGGCIHDGWISITNYEEQFSPDFLYHLLNSRPVQKYWDEKASSGSVRNLNSDIVRGTPLLVPPLSVQQQVVDILDRFDTLTTSLTDGLPAEIEARRQQYEYYRDRLLDFPRKGVA